MAGRGWWHSLERIDMIFRWSVNAAIGAFTLAATCWILGFALVAVAFIVLATTAVLIALFLWFRRDDLRPGRPAR